MTNSATFRDAVSAPVAKSESSAQIQARGSEVNTEPPYTSYEAVNPRPFLVDHYQLGDTWKEKMGGFVKEVDALNNYLTYEIESKKIDGSLSSVREVLKSLEKQANVNKTDRIVSKIAKISAYVDFLNKTRDL